MIKSVFNLGMKGENMKLKFVEYERFACCDT